MTALPTDPARVLADRYQLGDLIGSGGMADVYRGTDRVLLRPVAVKLLRDVSDPGNRERFVHEARTLASLNHPGLVTLLDAGVEEAHPYLVMEMVEGRTLTERLADGPLGPQEARDLGHQLATALAYAHGRGVVHRDVKPSNVLLTDDRALLVDFGIARLIGDVEHHTRTGDTIGSPAYLAPEQVVGEPITPAADIYSLGLVLLEALTGVRAYQGSAVEAAVARLNAAPTLPTSLGPAWCTLITRMTQRDPAARPDAGAVAAELGAGAPSIPEPATAVPDDATRAFPLAAGAVAAGALAADPLATGTIATAYADPPAVVPVTVPSSRTRTSRRLLPAAVALLALVAVAAFLLVQGRPDAATATQDPTTTNQVPAALRAPLAALHRAVRPVENRVPALTPRLAKIDAALATDQPSVAASALARLVDDADAAGADGRITAAETARIDAAASALLARLPGQPTTAVSVAPTTAPPAPREKKAKPAEKAGPHGKGKKAKADRPGPVADTAAPTAAPATDPPATDAPTDAPSPTATSAAEPQTVTGTEPQP